MQAKFIIGSFLLVTKVLAAGYAGALERVWLFYAYQIDELNKPEDRTIGVKCRSWDEKEKKCRPNRRTGEEDWAPCKGIMEDKRCSFSGLLNTLGKISPQDQLGADSDGNVLDLKATDIDPEESAKRVYARLLAVHGKVNDYPSYKVLYKGTNDYLDALSRIGDVVGKAAKVKENMKTHKKLFERFAETSDLIKTARVGDHGRWIIDGMEKALGPKGIDVKTKLFGPGHMPGDPSVLWQTVDWERTISDALSSGMYSEQELLLIVNEAREEYYKAGGEGDKHMVVMETFESIGNKMAACIPKGIQEPGT